MRKQKSRQNAPLLTRILSFLLVASMMLSMNAGIVIYAAAESVDTSHRLQNGSFEEGPSFTAAYNQVNQTDVPYWNTTAKGGLIELLKENPSTYIPGVKVKPSDGLIAAELNADEESTLYQDIKTYPSSVYKWGLDHGARNGTDTMALVIGPTQTNAPSKPDKNGRDQFMQMIDWLIAQNLTSIKTEAGLGEQHTVYSKKFDENGTFADNAGNNAFSLTPSTIYTEEWHIWIMASSKTTTDSVNLWYSYGENGDISSNSADPEGEIGLDTDKYYLYTVPEGQTETTFAFVSVGVYQSPVTAEKAKTYGNFLDNINFEIYYPLSGSTTTHGSAVVSDSSGSTEGEGASDGYKITVDDQLTTYITDGKTLKIQAVVKKEDADNSCEFVGVYCTTRDDDDNPVTKFIQTANNSNWERTVNENGDIIYTYYIENITSPIDLHFIFIKNPTITYDSNGGRPYIVYREYNTTEAANVYSFTPAVNQNAGEGESATIFIPPYTSHAATSQNDGWKFTGWLLTGDSTTETPPEELGRLILPAEHTVACDYALSHASSENAAQYFKVYDGNIHLTESIQDNEGVPSGVVWEDNGESIAYGNIHNGLTMIAQWRWRQAFVPQVNRNESYVDSAAGGTVSIRYDESNAEHYDASYNEHGGKAYYAQTNETVTATAAANDGFVFEGWYSASGKLITTNPTYSYTETKESVNTYYARFSDTVRQTYIRQVKNGDTYENTDDDSIATIDRYSYVDSVGKPISATALPTEEYKFDGWYDAEENEVSDDMLINDGMTISYTTTESAEYYARFSKKETRPTDRTISAVNYVGVYDGKNHSITVQNATIAGDIIYYSTDNINWSTTKPTRKDVQNKETVFVKVFNPIYKTVEANAYIKITPQPITITVNDAEKDFGDTDPVFTGGITNGTLVDDDDLGDIIYYRTNTDEAVDTYLGVLSAKYSANRNYDVDVVRGNFTIRDSQGTEARLDPRGGAKVYDGTPLYASARVVGAEGYKIYFRVGGSGWTEKVPFVTNVSEGKVTVQTKAVNEEGNELFGDAVTIQIKPRTIVLTSATDSKSYDETPLTNHNVTVTGDGFVDGEGADYHVTGSQTEVGSSENFFTYELHADTDASNYIIIKKEGTLTVTSVQTPDEPEEPDEPDKPSEQPKPSKPARPEKPSQPENPNPPTLTKDHVAYIIGYVDGTVRPNNLITRAEVTTIFFRLLSDESRSEFWSQTNPYSDVSRNLWCNNAISTLTNAGIILGYNDGTFKPDAPITRAQLAAIAVRFSTVIYDGDSTFNDVPSSHWASRYIALAEYLGWINGYRDNTFKPDQYITRAEAITLINRVLERDVEEEYMLPGMITWIDNPPYTWCYEAIQEATNSHDYTRTDKQSPEHDFNYEAWLRINPVPNWAGLEREWSTANSK